METKICTSIGQSKKLLSLGLDPSMADMWWSRCTITDFGDNNLKVSYAVTPCNISQFKNTDKDIPAWSLTALLELMPFFITIKEEGEPDEYYHFQYKRLSYEKSTKYNIYSTKCT